MITFPKSWARAERSILWVGITILLLIAMTAGVLRAVALAGDGEPFAFSYGVLPPAAIEDARLVEQWFDAHAPLTWVHILFGGIVLALVPFQFLPDLRRRYVRIHRWSGRGLLLAALTSNSASAELTRQLASVDARGAGGRGVNRQP